MPVPARVPQQIGRSAAAAAAYRAGNVKAKRAATKGRDAPLYTAETATSQIRQES